MGNRRLVAGGLAAGVWMLATAAHGAPQPLDTNDPQNGVLGIYSATFDGSTTPCTASSPPYCPFFRGDPPVVRNILIQPTPSRVINGVPNGFASPPAAGSFLDLTISPDHTQVTIAGGTVALPTLALVIDQGTPSETNIVASGAGMVFTPAAATTSIDASGVAVFQVDVAPTLAVDFSTLGVIVTSQNCTGPLCALVQILTLDMVRYQLVLTFDATFESFKGSFIGQTANNSMVFATLNSPAPRITVTDSVPPANDRTIPFGSVIVGQTADETVTVTNTGIGDLTVGQVAQADPLAAPFSVSADNCSGQVLPGGANCTVVVHFAPLTAEDFPAETFDIPYDGGTVTVRVTGKGAAPKIQLTSQDLRFGDVAPSSTADIDVTVANIGTLDLVVGNLGATDPLAAPYSLLTDNCSGTTLTPLETCTVTVRFAPTDKKIADDSFDIPSNDPANPSLTVAVHGGPAATGPTPDGANGGLFGSAFDGGSALALLLLSPVLRRRRRAAHRAP